MRTTTLVALRAAHIQGVCALLYTAAMRAALLLNSAAHWLLYCAVATLLVHVMRLCIQVLTPIYMSAAVLHTECSLDHDWMLIAELVIAGEQLLFGDHQFYNVLITSYVEQQHHSGTWHHHAAHTVTGLHTGQQHHSRSWRTYIVAHALLVVARQRAT